MKHRLKPSWLWWFLFDRRLDLRVIDGGDVMERERIGPLPFRQAWRW